MYVCVCKYMHMHVEAREPPQVSILRCCLPFYFPLSPLSGLVLAKQPGLASQWALSQPNHLLGLRTGYGTVWSRIRCLQHVAAYSSLWLTQSVDKAASKALSKAINKSPGWLPYTVGPQPGVSGELLHSWYWIEQHLQASSEPLIYPCQNCLLLVSLPTIILPLKYFVSGLLAHACNPS